jgi:hypothetical protein
MVSTELTGASNLVSLYRALGGDAATESVAIRASETPRPAGNNSP